MKDSTMIWLLVLLLILTVSIAILCNVDIKEIIYEAQESMNEEVAWHLSSNGSSKETSILLPGGNAQP